MCTTGCARSNTNRKDLSCPRLLQHHVTCIRPARVTAGQTYVQHYLCDLVLADIHLLQ